MKRTWCATLISLVLCFSAGAETFRTIVAGRVDISADQPNGATLPLSYVDSVVIGMTAGGRFLRGVELELKVPQAYLKYKGSIAVAVYTSLDRVPVPGVVDLTAERVGFDLIPNKLQSIYQIPIRTNHGFKASPYVSIPTGILTPTSFPILVRLMPIIKGLPEEIEGLRFYLQAKPVLADEGALRLSFRYPEKLKDRPVTVRVDDTVVDQPSRELILSGGDHHLAVVSEDYRNEARRFPIEPGKTFELTVELQDPTPVVSIEAPENAIVSFDGTPLVDPRVPFPAESGEHEILFRVGDYSIVKLVTLGKGKTYRIALSIDVTVTENE